MSYLQDSFGTWYNFLQPVISKPEFAELGKFISKVYKENIVYPEKNCIFEAFKQCPRNELKVIFIAQGPYENECNKNESYATGLAFANPIDVPKLSPSLRIIHGELENDLKKLVLDFDTTLLTWASQGVLLLNTALTVEKDKPDSHSEQWNWFTENVIKYISDNSNGIVWVLLGKHAQSYKKFINEDFHHFVEAAHPAEELYNKDAGFIGSKIFSQIDEKLNFMNGETIQWFSKFKT
jgi:uracil-DNA glycosylase